MRLTLILFFSFLLADISFAQNKQAFDITTYTTPKGWSKTEKSETLTFSKEEGTNFCMITIYKSIEGSVNADTNFEMAWQSLVQENLGVASKAIMQPGNTDKGWENRIGSAAFDKEGTKGVAVLISSSKNKILVNILMLTNTNAFQTEVEAYLESIAFTENSTAKVTEPVPAKSATGLKPKPELWVGRRLSASIYSTPDLITDRYVIYPNGDCNPNVPYEGLKDFDQSKQPESWGKFTMQGVKGKFKSKYDEIAVTRKSDVQLEKDGYSFSFYKCMDVDGLRIEGAYTHVSPDWGKDPKLNYLDGSGCQFVIHFKKDGTFDDKGIFFNGGDPNTNNCQGGKGTYSIENFTITFTYSDGRVVHRLFSAPPTRNPFTYNETYYIGHAAYYRKK
jgi:hypothetical protein